MPAQDLPYIKGVLPLLIDRELFRNPMLPMEFTAEIQG
jgi:hypothetical protein